MPKAIELLRQGRTEELWQMCCGFIDLDIDEFMEIQERLLLQQLELLNNCQLGRKLMHGKKPETLEEFRRLVPLTSYKDYCPELLEKREDILPARPETWAHTSGRAGDYPYKWIPITREYMEHLSVILCGVGVFSSARYRGDTSRIPEEGKVLYCVAPKPYISGTFADIFRMQCNYKYLPSLEEAEKMTYEERIREGIQMALSEGLDYFFGLSMVLEKVGNKFVERSGKIDIRPILKKPRALWRLTKGLVKSRLARRPMLPKDLWDVKGIISSGIDSWVYKYKIGELWGKRPLDIYSCTEGGVIATQTWDYEDMTFIPNMNFLEFIPEEEQLKNQMDRSYQPATLLLNEVRAGENYEIVITSFHGGSLVRYRIGDVVKITSLTNDRLGIKLPQMAFEQRVDGILDFFVVRLTEKTIWQAIEKTGIPYTDWIAYRIPGEMVLRLLIEPKQGVPVNDEELSSMLQKYIMETSEEKARYLKDDFVEEVGFKVEVSLLPVGTFEGYIARRQIEGADLAHIKPPHISPSEETLSILVAKQEKGLEAVSAEEAARK